MINIKKENQKAFNSNVKEVEHKHYTISNNCQQNYYPLDKMLKYNITFSGNIDLTQIGKLNDFFQRNKQFQNLIMEYMISMIEGICSTSFDLLVNNKCTQNEAKCYASKNILENIKYISHQISKIILNAEKQQMIKSQQKLKILERKKQEQIKRKYFYLQIYQQFFEKFVQETINQKQRQLQQKKIRLVRQIVEFICFQLSIYVQQIFHKYPSTPLSGYSKKLIDVIRSIDTREDYAFDFLYLNQIVIQKTAQEEFVPKIMQLLNKVISAPYQSIEGKDETFYQSFLKFNKNITWIVSKLNIKQDDLKLGQQIKVFNEITQEERIENKVQYLQVNTNLLYQFLILPSSQNTKNLKKFVENSIKKFKYDDQFIKNFQDDLLVLQKEHKFLANAKVSKSTLQFQERQIKNKQLKLKNSALLRILVKWVQDLKQTLKQSEKYLRDNGYTFKLVNQMNNDRKGKTDQNNNKRYEYELIRLNEEQRQILCIAAKQLKNTLKETRQNSAGNNMFVVDSIMEEEAEKVRYNFQNSLRFSSQINTFIAKETVKQLTQLLKATLEIEDNIQKFLQQQYKHNKVQGQKLKYLKKVNITCNRIGDLLRSKIYCTESQLIRLLTILYQLDKYCFQNKNPFFKLIRIKNKLKQTTNNIHINYMFHGKIQCELQICFITAKDIKIQKTNAMHHYLYELKRGIYGVIPQLANIVNQNDPINKHNQLSNLTMHKYSLKQNQFEKRQISQSQKKGYVWRCMYKKCNQFSLQGGFQFIKSKQNRYQCLKCYTSKNHKQDICSILSKLQYSQQNQWVRQLLQDHNKYGIQQISKLKQQGQNLLGVYLAIYPTQKRIFVQLFLIFKEKRIERLIFTPLQTNSNSKAKELNQNVYNDHKSRKNIYLKINYHQLQQYFEQKQNKDKQKLNRVYSQFQKFNVSSKDNKNKQIKSYSKYLQDQNIEKIKRKAIQQLQDSFFKKQIQNRQENLRLNKRLEVKANLQTKIRDQKLVFVERLYAQGIGVKDISNYNKLSNLKQLHLKQNNIGGQDIVCIFNYQSLTFIDLSRNNIKRIEFINLPNIKEIILDQNWLESFKHEGLNNLERLSIEQNYLASRMSFQQKLQSLKCLNLKDSKYLTEVDLTNCPSLKKLNLLSNYTQICITSSFKIDLQQMKAKYSQRSLQFIQTSSLQTLQLIKISIGGILQLQKRQFNSLRNIHIQLIEESQLTLNMIKKEIPIKQQRESVLKWQRYIKKIKRIEAHLFDTQKQTQTQKIQQKQRLIKQNISALTEIKQIKQNYQIAQFNQKQQFPQAQLYHIAKNIQQKYYDCIDYQKILQQFIIHLARQPNPISISIFAPMGGYFNIKHLTLTEEIQKLTINLDYLKELEIQSVSKINIISSYFLNSLSVKQWERVKQFKGQNIRQLKRLNLSKCTAIQSINIQNGQLQDYKFEGLSAIKQISIWKLNQQKQAKQLRCVSNHELTKIYLNGINLKCFQVINCNQVKVLILVGQRGSQVEKGHISLPHLKQLRLQYFSIDSLSLKLSAKQIKKIAIRRVKVLLEGQSISFYENDDGIKNFGINLQHLQIDGLLYSCSNFQKLLQTINTVKQLFYNMSSHIQFQDDRLQSFGIQKIQKYELSKICKQISSFILQVFSDSISIIVNVPIKRIQLYGQCDRAILQFNCDGVVQIQILNGYKQIVLVNNSKKRVNAVFKVQPQDIKNIQEIIKNTAPDNIYLTIQSTQLQKLFIYDPRIL